MNRHSRRRQRAIHGEALDAAETMAVALLSEARAHNRAEGVEPLSAHMNVAMQTVLMVGVREANDMEALNSGLNALSGTVGWWLASLDPETRWAVWSEFSRDCLAKAESLRAGNALLAGPEAGEA